MSKAVEMNYIDIQKYKILFQIFILCPMLIWNIFKKILKMKLKITLKFHYTNTKIIKDLEKKKLIGFITNQKLKTT